MTYFRLEDVDTPWGDYGTILKNGLIDGSTYSGDTEPLSVSRTGPFVPPISFPWGEVLVTDAVRARLEQERFTGLSFLPVPYAKTINLNWSEWDASSERPERMPAGGEPENYIMRGKHDPSLAAHMPKLWALDVPPNEGLQIEGTKQLNMDKVPDADIFRSYMLLWVSEHMAAFFEEHYKDWITCTPVD